MKNLFHKYRYFFLVALCLFFSCSCLQLHAQLLEANQPEQDACNAIELCGNTFTTSYSYQGRGLVYDLPATPCGSGEDNSVWLKVTVQTAGKIAFLIKPINVLDDYDFAVVKSDGNCDAIKDAPVIRCNFNNNLSGSNVNGIIGLSLSSNEPFVQGGATGSSFSQAIDAHVGDIYYVMVNNFGYSNGVSAGFTIDFSTSTATFANTTIPSLQNLVAACDYTKSVNIHLSNYALCSSVASDASDFVLTDQSGKTYPLLSASGVNCSGTVGYARDVHLEFANKLPNGDYTIQVKKGKDGNTILGLCEGETPEDSPPITFSIKLDSLQLVSIDTPACQKMRVLFNQTLYCPSIKSDGSQFWITGPSTVNILSATPSTSCNNGATDGIILTLDQPIDVDGMYTLHTLGDLSLYGTCNTVMYADFQKVFYVNSFNGLVNIFPDTTVCALGDQMKIVTNNIAPSPNGGFQYQWTNNNVSITNNELSPTVTINENKNHYLVQTVDNNGCVLRDTVNINVEKFTGSVIPNKSSICLNDTLQLNASDNAVHYSWYQDAARQTLATSTLSANNIPNPVFKPIATGDFTYYLTLESSKKCLDFVSTDIEVKAIPALTVAYNDTTINFGSNVELLADGADYYSWTPTLSLFSTSVADPVAHPISNTTYTVIGSNTLGCKVSDTVRVNIFFQDYAYFPTAFTPNNDGKNDIFRGHFFGKLNQYSLNVFDRWGQKIYSSNNPEQGWDGNMNGKAAPSGTYVWECIYHPDGQKNYQKKGTIVLIR